jgi:hypothetical protein
MNHSAGDSAHKVFMLPDSLFALGHTRCSVSTGQTVHFHRTVHPTLMSKSWKA